jgi:MoaA/NifB/PqqE/SkfB family radical SAM enzyme
MKPADIMRSWGRILSGYHPALSIEITKECPLSCPGCYAFQPEHLGGTPLTSVSDFKGDRLVERVLDLVEARRPLVIYFVGGEPLVRFRELSEILPRVSAKGIDVRVVTSAVRPIPLEWASIPKLGIVVSIDGLPKEHDARRKPATYERILKHIEGHRIVVHCTVTSQMMAREGYIDEFVELWNGRPEVGTIEVSFFTPQQGETSVEILTPEMRRRAVTTLASLKPRFPKLMFNEHLQKAYLSPPSNPGECIFATVTQCLSPNLETVVEPCQFGGNPKCTECGCLGSIGLHAVGQYRLPVGVKIATLFKGSAAIGSAVRRVRNGHNGAKPDLLPGPQPEI